MPPPIPAPRKESFEEEAARLKAEVERLRKAGDDLAEYIVLKDCIHENDMAALRWYNAKEGKPSV